jgi:uncharacterized paraquat-inducible protein A
MMITTINPQRFRNTHPTPKKKKKKCDESDSVTRPEVFSNSKAFCPRTTEAGLGVTESSILSFSSSFSISPRQNPFTLLLLLPSISSSFVVPPLPPLYIFVSMLIVRCALSKES